MEANIIQHPAMETQMIEHELEQTGTATLEYARQIVVSDQASYEEAAAYLQGIKARAKQVTDYWSEPKTAAYAAHQSVVSREKAMLQPMKDAEAIVKRTMGAYLQEMERQRMQEAAEARKRAQEERDRLLAEAVVAESSGDGIQASVNLAMASMVEDMPTYTSIEKPTATGISTSRVWKARITNRELVPIIANGTEIRPVDERALNTIAKLTKGTATIPGIEFYEDLQMSVRS